MRLRPARPRGAARTAAVAAVLVAGCGGSSGDLMAIERTGPGTLGATQRIVVTGDGRGRCGAAGPVRPIASGAVIEARELERELGPLAERAAAYEGSPGRDRFVARTRAGTVRWTSGVARLPRVLPRAELFYVGTHRELCRARRPGA